MKIDSHSQDWLAVAAHLESLLEHDCKALETAQEKNVIVLQSRIALLRKLLTLPSMSRPVPLQPLGFESTYVRPDQR